MMSKTLFLAYEESWTYPLDQLFSHRRRHGECQDKSYGLVAFL